MVVVVVVSMVFVVVVVVVLVHSSYVEDAAIENKPSPAHSGSRQSLSRAIVVFPNRNHDVPKLLPCLHVPVRCRNLLQWETAIDQGSV